MKYIKQIMLVAIVFMSACMAIRSFVLFPIRPHLGHGEFKDISQRVGPFALPGYSIQFPEIDLSEPFEETYQFSSLPEMSSYVTNLYFCIHDFGFTEILESRLKKASNGTIQFELCDSAGRKVIDVTGRLSTFRVNSGGNKDFVCLYQDGKAGFVARKHESYTMRLKYVPDQELVGYRGFMYMKTGGDK